VLTLLSSIPDGLLTTTAADLHRILPGPTLFHLPGRKPGPLFVSVLLHGNEDTGLKAIQQVLRKHSAQTLPRALSVFVGNVAAARENVRRLERQPDFNRVWPGTDAEPTPESHMMQRVVDEMRGRNVWASIDIHNNTGLNPHYACINRIEPRFLQLANLFSRIAVYVTRPLGVQSAALARLCPALTVECGKPGNEAREGHCAAFVDAVLHLAEIPTHSVAAHDIDLYHTVGIAKMSNGTSFSFTDTAADTLLDANLDHLNFRELPAGTRFAAVRDERSMPLHVTDESAADVTGEYFEIVRGELRTRRPVMPAMLTLNELSIQQDCLCYLMERLGVRGEA
jgi:succinylglutamate desuccinylase